MTWSDTALSGLGWIQFQIRRKSGTSSVFPEQKTHPRRACRQEAHITAETHWLKTAFFLTLSYQMLYFASRLCVTDCWIFSKSHTDHSLASHPQFLHDSLLYLPHLLSFYLCLLLLWILWNPVWHFLCSRMYLHFFALIYTQNMGKANFEKKQQLISVVFISLWIAVLIFRSI